MRRISKGNREEPLELPVQLWLSGERATSPHLRLKPWQDSGCRPEGPLQLSGWLAGGAVGPAVTPWSRGSLVSATPTRVKGAKHRFPPLLCPFFFQKSHLPLKRTAVLGRGGVGRQDSWGLVKFLVQSQGCRWQCGPGCQQRWEGSKLLLLQLTRGTVFPGHSPGFLSTPTQHFDGLPGNKRA